MRLLASSVLRISQMRSMQKQASSVPSSISAKMTDRPVRNEHQKETHTDKSRSKSVQESSMGQEGVQTEGKFSAPRDKI